MQNNDGAEVSGSLGKTDQAHLAKFILGSALSLFIGTIHGVVQTLAPVRAWLDLIGPHARMIDPLAHAHIAVVGGIVLAVMGMGYRLLPDMVGKAIFSRRMIDHSFWWTFCGMLGMYSVFMFFGINEGLLSQSSPEDVAGLHKYYPFFISAVGVIMSVGLVCYCFNLLMTYLRRTKR